MRRALRALTLALPFAVAGCTPPIVPPGPGAPPQIACSAPVLVEGVVGATAPATYTAPLVTGGASPIAVTCTPVSGTAFTIGETIVTCTAVDAIARQATCTFPVTVRHRDLAVTNFVAFGDSMTEGQNGRPINFIPFVDIPNAYPTILQQLFTTRIPTQQIVVVNQGLGGERVTANEARLRQVLTTYRPPVLLFLEGANDLLAAAAASTIADGVRQSIATARGFGVQYVFVSTLMPVAPGNCVQPPALPRCRAGDVPLALPATVNQLIRQLVPANGAYLVDPYDEFVMNSATYIDLDGLHLQPAGNRALASAFFNRIFAVIPAKQLSGLSGWGSQW